MPPGYVNPCPDLTLPLTQWVLVTWVAAYVLCAETLALGLGLLVFQLRRTIPRGVAASMLVVTGCALTAIALGLWMIRRNAQFCGIAPHYTPEYGAQVARALALAVVQAHIALGVLAALFVLGTALTIVTLIRGWRASRRRSAARLIAS